MMYTNRNPQTAPSKANFKLNLIPITIPTLIDNIYTIRQLTIKKALNPQYNHFG